MPPSLRFQPEQQAPAVATSRPGLGLAASSTAIFTFLRANHPSMSLTLHRRRHPPSFQERVATASWSSCCGHIGGLACSPCSAAVAASMAVLLLLLQGAAPRLLSLRGEARASKRHDTAAHGQHRRPATALTTGTTRPGGPSRSAPPSAASQPPASKMLHV